MTIRILNLEDDPLDSELVRRELTKAGIDFELTRVSSFVEFDQALRDQPPDLIISDHNVPEFHGTRALELAKQVVAGTPFILLTGSLSEEAAVNYMKAGAADYILKDRMIRLGSAALEALDRARERRALRAYEGFLRQIIDANPNLIFVRDQDGRFLLVNRALADAYGTTVENAIGKTDADLNVLSEETERFLSTDQEVISTGQPKLIAEQPLTNAKTGETRWFHTIKVPLRLPNQDDRTVLGVATDVTDRKRLEEQLRQVQKMEAVGQLAGGVAHDFNNILTTVLGHTELLLSSIKDEEHRRDLEQIRGAAQHAASLTRQLLAFSRKQILQPKDLDINELVRELEQMLRRVLAENIEIRLHLAPNLGSVSADPTQLRQVLVNLALNARDAMPEGGKLIIETANVVLDERYSNAHVGMVPGRYVSVVVSDTGHGMDERTKARLFEPFFTTKGVGQGTGLGLSMVYGIVKQSGGWIWVYSEPNHGASFRIYLPRVDAVPVSTGAPIEDAPVPTGTETVLLVEDAPAVRGLAVRVLEEFGYHVLEAPNGADALKVAAAHQGKIDLLLTDVVMPGMSGRDLAKELVVLRPDVRVLYTSGHTDDAIVHQGALDEGVAFIQKPFTPDGLARRVRQVLDGPEPG